MTLRAMIWASGWNNKAGWPKPPSSTAPPRDWNPTLSGHHNLASALEPAGASGGRPLVEHREAVRISPDTPVSQSLPWAALVNAGQPDEALKEFQKPHQLDPHYPWPHLETARIYLRQNRDADARRTTRALRIDPDNIETLTFTAKVLAASEKIGPRARPERLHARGQANLLTGGRRAERAGRCWHGLRRDGKIRRRPTGRADRARVAPR